MWLADDDIEGGMPTHILRHVLVSLIVPICTHSIPGYALELFSLPMSSSLFVLFSLPGLSFIFACLLACIAEGTYAGLYSWVPMVHGPRVLIRRICANNNNNNKPNCLVMAVEVILKSSLSDLLPCSHLYSVVCWTR